MHTKKNITVGLSAVIFFFMLSCSQTPQKQTIEGFYDRTRIPDLDVTDVVTLISDSGVTRYRIQSPRWLVYNKATSPYWYFPEGIRLEDFDQQMKVFAHLRADKARYDYNNQIWRLEGKVEAKNTRGEVFRTPRLFWNQKTEIVYSDTLTEVNSNGTVLKGKGFLSNQTMTKYTIKDPTGYTTDTENRNNTSKTGNTSITSSSSSSSSSSGSSGSSGSSSYSSYSSSSNTNKTSNTSNSSSTSSPEDRVVRVTNQARPSGPTKGPASLRRTTSH